MAKKAKKGEVSIMQKILALPGKIIGLESGKTFQFLVGWFLRIGSVAVVLATLNVDYKILSALKGKMPVSYFIGGGLSVLGISFTGYIGAGILYLRAGRILSGGALLKYPMLFLFAEIIQIFTELLGVMVILISTFIGMVSLLLSATGGKGLLGFAPFLAGLYGWGAAMYFFMGIAFLLFGHAFRDFLTILIRIESNTAKK